MASRSVAQLVERRSPKLNKVGSVNSLDERQTGVTIYSYYGGKYIMATNMKWKIIEWSKNREPKVITYCNSMWGAKIYKFFNYDILFFANSPYIHWSIEKNV